jgi:hypothetical protein
MDALISYFASLKEPYTTTLEKNILAACRKQVPSKAAKGEVEDGAE